MTLTTSLWIAAAGTPSAAAFSSFEFTEEIVDKLVSDGVATTKGTDIFFDRLPDVTADPAIVIYDAAGEPGELYSEAVRPDVRYLVRSGSYATAFNKALAVHENFHQKTNVSLTDTRIITGKGTAPGSIGRDEANRSQVEGTFKFRTVLLPSGCLTTITNLALPTIGRTVVRITFNTNISTDGGVWYRASSGPTSSPVWVEFPFSAGTSHSVTISGLVQNTWYDFYIVADCQLDPLTAPATFHQFKTASASGPGEFEEEQ